MIKKILTGIVSGSFVGVFVTAIILPDTSNLLELFLTKITATSIITGILCGIYSHFSKSKLQVFFVSILIGIIIFFLKHIIIGHDLDAITMGAFVGAMLGGVLAVTKKLTHSFNVYKKLRRRRRKGFGTYS
ncbi:hypothetical protein SHK09_14615 [Polaribacter sp. PL03]|uniref:hypothetical protein n=1 Tax=Polaribacter sp. PL03 TaxID=3088353 RepID=UPI0029D3951F|nr:hypothetical protein [Polaribacter sp. PL03]MDX6748027.1 hypothetical protein [Polaribacter sp. PL03]